MNARRVVDARATVSAIAVRRRERSDRDDRGLGIVSEVDCEVTPTGTTSDALARKSSAMFNGAKDGVGTNNKY